MADKSKLEQMLENLVNDNQAKAEELFHEYVVEASREIYESLIDSEISEEEDKDEDEEVDEAADDDEAEEDKVEENFDEFEDLTVEADDEEGADATDDLLGDVEMGDDEGGEGEEDLESKVMDLEDAVEELEAKFAELAGEEAGEEEGDMGDEMGMGDDGEEDKMKDSFDQELATMREYVEKVAGGHGAEKKGAGEKGADTKSPVAGKNDMGGTTANIAKGGEGGGSDKGLLSPKTKEDNAGNINTPGAKNGNAFSTKEPGHGAEKKGSAETADNKQSLFRK
jgi:hypothetical protein